MSLGTSIDRWQCRRAGRPKLSSTDIPSEFIELGSGLTRVAILGEGTQSLLICPDGPCGLEHYRDLLERLEPYFRIVAFEPPGFGYSRVSKGYDHSLDAGARFIRELMDATETETAVLSLPCVAGLMATSFALAHPERVDALVSVQTPDWAQFQRWVNRVDAKGLARMPVVGQAVFWGLSQRVQDQWYRAAEPNKTQLETIRRIHQTRNVKSTVFCFASTLQGLRGEDPFLGQTLRVPTAIVWGSSDRTHGRADPASFQLYAPEAQVVEIAEAGHFPELTDPARFVDTLRAVADRYSG